MGLHWVQEGEGRRHKLGVPGQWHTFLYNFDGGVGGGG